MELFFRKKKLNIKRTNSEKFGVTLSYVNAFFAQVRALSVIISTIQWNPDFSNLQGKRKLSAKNRIVQKCKITMFDSPGRETTFGSNYWEVRKNEGSRNPYSTENNFPSLSSMAANYISNCRLNIASLSDAKCFFFCPI